MHVLGGPTPSASQRSSVRTFRRSSAASSSFVRNSERSGSESDIAVSCAPIKRTLDQPRKSQKRNKDMTWEGFSLLHFIVKWRRSRLSGRRARPDPRPRVFYGNNHAFVFDLAAAYRSEEFIHKSDKWSITTTTFRPHTVLINHPHTP